MQIKSLISIVNHQRVINILGNIFTHNSGTKGIIYIDAKPRQMNTGIIIAHNIFTMNIGYIDASVIFLRARRNPGITISNTIPTEGNL